ncbi:MAG: hemolysin III family protein [Holophagales bacterium]|nr:MAG: hemolysin III family protein [Holophagales bacterium]
MRPARGKLVEVGGVPQFSVGEEIAHGVSHGVGIVLSIAGLVILVACAALRGNVWHVATSAVFGTTLILLYVASTLYHSVPILRAKRVLRVLDHSAIYLLIAGTYTPLTLVTLRGPWGWTLFAIVWSSAVAGVIFKSVALGRARIFSVVLYVLMGWCVVIAIKPLLAALAPGGVMLLFGGGLAYTLGLIFYGWQSMRYHHFLWHLFVMLGSVLHYFAVLFYVIPRP